MGLLWGLAVLWRVVQLRDDEGTTGLITFWFFVRKIE